MLVRLSQQEDHFLEESITVAENERTAMAKSDTMDRRRKTINVAHNQSNAKPTAGITQLAQNTTYRMCTAFRRTATRLLTNMKQVTFGETHNIQAGESANTVHLTYDSRADGHYISKDNRKEAACPSYAHPTKRSA